MRSKTTYRHVRYSTKECLIILLCIFYIYKKLKQRSQGIQGELQLKERDLYTCMLYFMYLSGFKNCQNPCSSTFHLPSWFQPNSKTFRSIHRPHKCPTQRNSQVPNTSLLSLSLTIPWPAPTAPSPSTRPLLLPCQSYCRTRQCSSRFC